MEHEPIKRNKIIPLAFLVLTGGVIATAATYSWFKDLPRSDQAAYAAKLAIGLTPDDPDRSRILYEGLNRMFGSGENTCGNSWTVDYLSNNPEHAWTNWQECDHSEYFNTTINFYEDFIGTSLVDRTTNYNITFIRSSDESSIQAQAERIIAAQHATQLAVSDQGLTKDFILSCLKVDSRSDHNYVFETVQMLYQHNEEIAKECLQVSSEILNSDENIAFSSENFDHLSNTAKVLSFIQKISMTLPELQSSTYEEKLIVATNILNGLEPRIHLKDVAAAQAYLDYFEQNGVDNWEMILAVINLNLFSIDDPYDISGAEWNYNYLTANNITLKSHRTHYYSHLSEYHAMGSITTNTTAAELIQRPELSMYTYDELDYLVYEASIYGNTNQHVILNAIQILNQVGIEDPYLMQIAFREAGRMDDIAAPDFLGAVAQLANLLQTTSDSTLLSVGDALDVLRWRGAAFDEKEYNIDWFLEELNKPEYNLSENDQVDLAIGIWSAVSIGTINQQPFFSDPQEARIFLDRFIRAFTSQSRFSHSSSLTRSLAFEATRWLAGQTVPVDANSSVLLEQYIETLPASSVVTYPEQGTLLSMGACVSSTAAEARNQLSTVLTDYDGVPLGLTMTRDQDGTLQFNVSPFYPAGLNGRIMIGVDPTGKLEIVTMTDFATQDDLRDHLAASYIQAWEPTMLIADTNDFSVEKLNYLYMSGYAIWLDAASAEMGIVSFANELTRTELPGFIEMLLAEGKFLITPDYGSPIAIKNQYAMGPYYVPDHLAFFPRVCQ